MDINGLPIPDLLLQLIVRGEWYHPGDEVLQTVIPQLYSPVADPVTFLPCLEAIERSSAPPQRGDFLMATYKEGLGSDSKVPDLPWVDAEKRIFIAVCAVPGADVGIALDYRPSMTTPRVVALVYRGDEEGFQWTHVAHSFEEFVDQCGLGNG